MICRYNNPYDYLQSLPISDRDDRMDRAQLDWPKEKKIASAFEKQIERAEELAKKYKERHDLEQKVKEMGESLGNF